MSFPELTIIKNKSIGHNQTQQYLSSCSNSYSPNEAYVYEEMLTIGIELLEKHNYVIQGMGASGYRCRYTSPLRVVSEVCAAFFLD